MQQEKAIYPSIDKPWLKYYTAEALNAPLPACTLYEMIWQANRGHFRETALNYYGHKVSYGELFVQIERAAKAFAACGVKKGDVVMLCSVNTPETVYAFYALNRLGAIANMVDPRTSADGVRGYIEETNTRVVVTIEAACPLFAKAAPGTSVEQIVSISPADSLPKAKAVAYRLKNKAPKPAAGVMSWREFIRQGENVQPAYPRYQKDACCVIAHTGGTTGLPKGVMLSNDNINAVSHSYRHTDIPFQRGQRYFNDLPPFIMYGFVLATHTVLAYGLEMILYPYFDSKGFPKQFIKYKPQHFSGVSDHLQYMIEDRKIKKTDLSFLISAGVGGDDLDNALEKRTNDFLHVHGCHYAVVKGFGMTESGATAIISSEKANALGSIGIPLVCNTVKIVDTETGRELPCGQTGELWLSGPSVMLGYYKKPKETAEMISTDEQGRRWIHTGDLARVTEQGLVFHEGRIRRIYLTTVDGQPAKIFPMQVENVIKEVPGVETCTVVGRTQPHSAYYESVAFVVPDKSAPDHPALTATLKAHCAESVPSYMCPVEYRYLYHLPHTLNGKVDFRALEEQAKNK